ncbi:MAG: glycogen debranching protein GlgX [Dehalococcoidia bacterium]
MPGNPFPLGATWDGKGVNFAVYSEKAEKMELCLFDEGSVFESECIAFREVRGQIWNMCVPGLRPGQLYMYRASGPYQPGNGLRFNRNKLLLDPYARAISGKIDWQSPLYGYDTTKADDLVMDSRDDSAGTPRCVVIDPSFDWDNDRPPSIPWPKSIIYETHVRGCTIQHPEIEARHRGSYAALASDVMLDYFKRLGITALELMPVHEFTDDKGVINRGLTNYWGYYSINYFSPTSRYSSSGDGGGQVVEFKRMVKALHRAGIEVILDVVYNHTAEGNQFGPTLSYRGIDNETYYRLDPSNKRYYVDYTGTGNSLNVQQPQVLKLIMDSLRYWVTEMHVDGFRFDLASALARNLHEVDRLSAFFDIIQEDPVISQVKLIAEPWDVGQGGYQVGNFPILWTEWNAKYRDTLRRFWRGDEGQVGDLAYRLTGSSDLYQDDGRRPYASINYITAHDGFTLQDLVSYNQKHNEANGVFIWDGMDENLSFNCGAEGATDDQSILDFRERQKRNFIAALMLSQGVPMIYGGDELSRTQGGNNNAYCQDNRISWYDWDLDAGKKDFQTFVKDLCCLRRDHPVFRRRQFFSGRPIRGQEVRDIVWLRPDGSEMAQPDWDTSWVHCVGLLLDGEALDEYDDEGNSIQDDTFLMVLNAYKDKIPFKMPEFRKSTRWQIVLDTSKAGLPAKKNRTEAGKTVDIPPNGLMLFMRINK